MPFQNLLETLTKDVSFGEDIDLILGLTTTAFAADQLLKAMVDKKHMTRHLGLAGLSGVAAAAAFTMMRREHRERHPTARPRRHRSHRHGTENDLDSDCDDGCPHAQSPSRTQAQQVQGEARQEETLATTQIHGQGRLQEHWKPSLSSAPHHPHSPVRRAT
ncbi:uncharacterized protein THITE_2086328 [Thermothielavioides terrestris NRRL 8126]|uniref:Uncharacterized protein n=1 Tax=Thermothielavioides terrestris (strain ATCC 38088 / NRRL 8126) TaxID=578455 RepID=G2R0U7_THETT|nr:uncharacterized protein THITE_2086328 [Thermothielavioides terrestris NRRL 8126]AEO64839.1 hypothetical protein THITE_2086328 [Thermothielavioides terrestris NRRL 8126]